MSLRVCRWKKLTPTTQQGVFTEAVYEADVEMPINVVQELAASGDNPLLTFSIFEADEREKWVFQYIGVPDIPANRGSFVWVFQCKSAEAGVFTEFRLAALWARQHKVSGLLTRFPLNQGIYDWAVENDYLTEKQIGHGREGLYLGTFKHFHFENGECLNWPEYFDLDEKTAREEEEEMNVCYPAYRAISRDATE